MVTRREALRNLGIGVAAAGLAGCAPLAARVRHRAEVADFTPPTGPNDPAVRLYGRAGFGHRPGDLQAYRRDGHAATVERLLRADAPEDPALTMQIMRLDVFRVDAMELRDYFEDVVLHQLQQAAILRAVHGANPLQERMADFWTNHFCIYGRKGLAAWRKGKDETEVVRNHALGKFPEMLRASARSPAMVAFLDGRANRKGTPNENYARELMELHTMGVDGGYTQRDIQEVARCFTGWTLEDRFMRHRGAFRFVPELHDDGEKYVLGQRIPPGGGEADGDRVLQILADHPSTGRFLAKKLVRHFTGDGSPRLETTVAAAYQKSGGDIREMVRPILTSDELLSGPAILKRPLDLVASSLRALDASTDGGKPIRDQLAIMGQPLYEWPMPDGFPTDTEAWAGAMLPRWNYAFTLAQGGIGGTSVDLARLAPDVAVSALLGQNMPGTDVRVVASTQEAVALTIASPEFQWR